MVGAPGDQPAVTLPRNTAQDWRKVHSGRLWRRMGKLRLPLRRFAERQVDGDELQIRLNDPFYLDQ